MPWPLLLTLCKVYADFPFSHTLWCALIASEWTGQFNGSQFIYHSSCRPMHELIGKSGWQNKNGKGLSYAPDTSALYEFQRHIWLRFNEVQKQSSEASKDFSTDFLVWASSFLLCSAVLVSRKQQDYFGGFKFWTSLMVTGLWKPVCGIIQPNTHHFPIYHFLP